ncbi:cytochrome c oxidase subunit 3 [Candidatus Laterigemmans baculatus]|uniref:cytochrome c oxidase subunit 3 n=1 Tax=Candidatus Laterigemmans baculatus TaxID=2770505 RepID=UPI0013DA88E0|nr:cytochrome c oxidase subunit 3 [Candidatus Laterigemmans baculatus]
MATTEALPHDATAEDHDHGDHPAFLAHHFDTPEQQFDSGKLGIWLFLVTEVMMFSGLFCAYAIYRAMRPEVFVGSSVFLNTQLGAVNTGVLLFSSLTMAWAVRCAQLEQHRMLVGMLGATLGCASLFLGVKSIEYSHKMDLGLLPAGFYSYDPHAVHHHEGLSPFLIWMAAPFAIATIGLLVWYVIAKVRKNAFQSLVAGPLLAAGLSFFAGVGLGMLLESGESTEGVEHVSESAEESLAEIGPLVGEEEGIHRQDPVEPTGVEPIDAADAENEPAVARATGVVGQLAQQETNSGVRQQLLAEERQAEMASGRITTSAEDVTGPVGELVQAIDTPRLGGVFFSIYYCITGLHAFHILVGMGFLTWLIVRAARREFESNYFGPVDYVGLYWHIVDLIWIYVFPLLYLIR